MASNVTPHVSASEDILTCKICKKQLKVPHILQQCYHSYCKTCLDTIPKKDKDGETGCFCLECNSFSKDDEIKENGFLVDILGISKAPTDKKANLICKACPKNNDACSLCMDCKIELCQDCKVNHFMVPVTKGHTVKSIDDQTEQFIDKLLFCEFHKDRQIEFNCQKCETLTCSFCHLSDHNTHPMEVVDQALERLTPLMYRNVEHITENINIIEAQIDAVTTTIEETKEAYCYCRMEMEDRLEKLINRLKAVKAKMEEDVNEQETIALDILQNIKQKLENQLSQWKNLTKLAIVITEKARHTSLLSELQSGLFDKVKEFAQHEQQEEPFQIQIPEFNECKVEELQKLIGEVQYDRPSFNIDTAGVIWRDRNFICQDLSKFMGKELKKVQEIDIDIPWCNRLSYINNKLWTSLAGDEELRIYNCSGQLIKTVHNNEQIAVVKQANNGDIIAGGGRGLFVTNDECSEWIKLADGKYSDISIHGNKFTALRFDKLQVVTLALKKNKDGNNRQWTQVAVFDLPEQDFDLPEQNFDLPEQDFDLPEQNFDLPEQYYNLPKQDFHLPELPVYDLPEQDSEEKNISDNCYNTILVDNDNKVIITKNKFIYTFTEYGDLLKRQDIKEWYPVLCGIDRTGKVLVGGFPNGKLYVTDNLAEISGCEVTNTELNIKCEEICDAAIDGDGNMWTLQGNDLPFKLVKYSIVQLYQQ